MRLFSSAHSAGDEHLLWTRDTRFAHRFAASAAGSRILELDSGAVVIGPSGAVTDIRAAEVAREVGANGYGLVRVDRALPEADRYLTAMSAAVQASGLAERIGMAQTTRLIQDRMLDYFFSLRMRHGVVFQPIVKLSDGILHEYECLFRPDMPMRPRSISAIVQAAIDTERSVELDAFLITTTLDRVGELVQDGAFQVDPVLRLAINATPASLLDPRFEAAAFAARVRGAGIEPHQVTVECTEQQAVADVVPLQHAVTALRRAGFGFAVDDAGAGYASFALIAALRPTVIKIDREIVAGIARDDAKQALVEAFVSFGRRIGARLLAEGIERRADLALVQALGVDLGQGYLLGRPTVLPEAPRSMDLLSLDGARTSARAAIGGRVERAAQVARMAGNGHLPSLPVGDGRFGSD